jgi:hypothetical protein
MEPKTLLIDETNSHAYVLREKVARLIDLYEREIWEFKSDYHYKGSPDAEDEINSIISSFEI